MPRQSMMAAAGDGGTSFASHRLEAIHPQETYQAGPELVSSAGAPSAAGHQLGGDEVQQQTTMPQQAPPHTPHQNHVVGGIGGLVGGCDAAEEAESGGKWLKEMRGSLLVVASLLASVTYQAGMNPPGGLWQDTSPEGTKKPHRAGDPVLQDTDSGRFALFNVFNYLAFAYAVGTMMHLITESVVVGWPGGPRRFRSLLGFGSVRTMKNMMIASLLSLGVAFAAGSCRSWWCSLGVVFTPLYYFFSSVALDLLYCMFRKRQQKRLVSSTMAQQVEVAVEHHGSPGDHGGAPIPVGRV